MPEWMHNRAEHILAKNPSMPKSEAFAIATQQMHSGGHGPKGYGTAEGRRTAKAKFSTPKDDQQWANPGGLESPKLKHASLGSALVTVLTKVGFTASSYGGQPAQNPPGMKGQSQIPPFVAPPIEVKAAAALGAGIRNFAKAVKGEGKPLRAAAERHRSMANSIRDNLGRKVDLKRQTVDLPPMRGGWAHSTQALETDARRHARAGHLSGVLADVADKETRKARAVLGGGVAATAGGVGAAMHGARKEKEAGVGVGAGMSASQYSGPLSMGAFKQTSQIPPFTAPPIEQSKTAAPATGAMGAAGKLRATQRVGGPKTTGFSGPSISEISKPRGFGMPLSGTLKNQL